MTDDATSGKTSFNTNFFRKDIELVNFIKPDYVMAYNNLAVAFIRKGDIKQAIVNFRKALSISPDDNSTKKNLNKALMMQQQKVND